MINNQKGKISASQGSMLSSYILENGYKWNGAYDGKAIVINNYERLVMSDDIRLIVLSPTGESLEKLKKRWRKELERKKSGFQFEDGKLFDDAYEFFMMRQDEKSDYGIKRKISAMESFSIDLTKPVELDTSETNESSIAFIIEYKTHKVLFLGDSNPKIITTSLLELKEKENYDMNFDLVKISHHGSPHNTNMELLDVISSSRWVVSGNGEHGNPNIDVIKLILNSNREIKKKLYFNYHSDWIDLLNNEFLMSEYRYEVITPQIGESISIVLEG